MTLRSGSCHSQLWPRETVSKVAQPVDHMFRIRNLAIAAAAAAAEAWSMECLRGLVPGDGVWLRHSVAKNRPVRRTLCGQTIRHRVPHGSRAVRVARAGQVELGGGPRSISALRHAPVLGPKPGDEFMHAELDIRSTRRSS